MNRSPDAVISAMSFAALDSGGAVTVLLGDNEIARLVLEWRERASQMIELREAAYDYARLVQIESFDRHDIAVHHAYERLRAALGQPIGLSSGRPQLATSQ